jgi:hypothetical protein
MGYPAVMSVDHLAPMTDEPSLGSRRPLILDHQCRRPRRHKRPPIVQLRRRRVRTPDAPLDVLELGSVFEGRRLNVARTSSRPNSHALVWAVGHVSASPKPCGRSTAVGGAAAEIDWRSTGERGEDSGHRHTRLAPTSLSSHANLWRAYG